jgi:hypothetical protein
MYVFISVLYMNVCVCMRRFAPVASVRPAADRQALLQCAQASPVPRLRRCSPGRDLHPSCSGLNPNRSVRSAVPALGSSHEPCQPVAGPARTRHCTEAGSYRSRTLSGQQDLLGACAGWTPFGNFWYIQGIAPGCAWAQHLDSGALA